MLELTTADTALPFETIEPARLVGSYRNARYSVPLVQGSFRKAPGAALCIHPERNCIVLDCAAR